MTSSPVPAWDDRGEHLAALRRAALDAVDPAAAVRRWLRLDEDVLLVGDRYFPFTTGQVFLVGAGKAGVAMAGAAEAILGDRLAAGVMAVPAGDKAGASKVRWVEAGHPLPNEGSVEAARAMQDLLRSAGENDLVLALISGGGSALLELPVAGLELAELQAVTDSLLRSGASIQEMNRVRHRLSQVKGGGLARWAAPAQVITLILSDVVGDDPAIIASGPTVAAETTAAETLEVLKRYGLPGSLPPAVTERLESGGDQAPPPMAGAEHFVIGSNRLAALAAMQAAQALGFNALLLTTFLEGEARAAGRLLAGLAKGIRSHDDPVRPPGCLVLGGETTVRVTGKGAGGRNQELALSAAIALDGWPRIQLMALATDGVDGPTPAAGAVVSGSTLAEARARGLDAHKALAANDSYPFLDSLGATLKLGPTGTNVNDLAFILVYP